MTVKKKPTMVRLPETYIEEIESLIKTGEYVSINAFIISAIVEKLRKQKKYDSSTSNS